MNTRISLSICLMAGLLSWQPRAAWAAAPAGTKARQNRDADSSGSKTAPIGQRRFDFDKTTGPSTFLVGAKVHTGNGRTIEDAVVEIVGSRIRRVAGSEAKSAIPDGANVIDVAGKIITPGLVAADSNIGLVEIGAESSTRDDRRGGESHPIRAAYRVNRAINAESSLIPVNAIEGVTTAAVSPNGGLVSGQVAWIDLVYGDYADIVASSTVAIDASLGQAYKDSRAATLAKLREALTDAEFYRRNQRAVDRRRARKLAAHPLDLQALLPVLDGAIPLTVTAHRASDILALIELAEDFDIDLVITGGAQAWKVADALAEARVPVLLQPSHNLPYSLDMLGARLDNAALLHQAGVTIGIASLEEAHNVRNVTQEAGIAIANGLDYQAALSAVTHNIARIYGLEEDYGTLAPGRVANLVVWDGDPFELAHWPTRVYIRGESIPMVSRQTILRDRYLDLSEFDQ